MKKFMAMILVVLMVLSQATMAWAEETTAPEDSWQHILLMGGDSRDTSAYGNTDCNVIISINPEENQVKLTSIMRDTWVEFPGIGKSGKINAANVYGGPELMLDTVNKCFDMNIDKYIMINMSDLIYIIDLIGGVDIEVTTSEMNYTNGRTLYGQPTYDGDTKIPHAGNVHLNGLLALSYSRNRSDDDYHRVMRQQKVLIAMARQMQNMDINELMEIADQLLEKVETNLEKDEIEQLAKVGLIFEVEDVSQLRIPADGTFQSGTFSGTWMIKPDFEKNAEILREFIYGE